MMTSVPPQIPPKKHQKSISKERQEDAFGDDLLPATNQRSDATKFLDDIVSNMKDSLRDLDHLKADSSASEPLHRVDVSSDIMTTSLPILPSEVVPSAKAAASPRPTPRPRRATRKATSPSTIAPPVPTDRHVIATTSSAAGTDVMSQSTPTVMSQSTPTVITHAASPLSGSDHLEVKLPPIPRRSVDPVPPLAATIAAPEASLAVSIVNSPVPTPRARPAHRRANSDFAISNNNSSKILELNEIQLPEAQVSSHNQLSFDTESQFAEIDCTEDGAPPKPPREWENDKITEPAVTVGTKMTASLQDLPPLPEKPDVIHSVTVEEPAQQSDEEIENCLPMPTIAAPRLPDTFPIPAEGNASKSPKEEPHKLVGNSSNSVGESQIPAIDPSINSDFEEVYEEVVSSTKPKPGDSAPTPSAVSSINTTSSINEDLFPSDGIYDNTSNRRLPSLPPTNQSSEVIGIPLPPSNSTTPADAVTLTPLSNEDRRILDPTEYMSLWELQGPAPLPHSVEPADLTPTEDAPTDGNSAVASETHRQASRKKSGPPIPLRLSESANTTPHAETAFPYLQFSDTSFSTTSNKKTPFDAVKSALRPANPFATSISADEFRNSYLLPLPSDPFADVKPDDIFCFDNPALSPAAQYGPEASSTAQYGPEATESSVYSLADNREDKKLIPNRPAPAIPTKPRPSVDALNTSLYAEINKPPKLDTRAATQEDPTYCLAGDVMDSGFDNHAASYDSEDTLDEDSESEDSYQPTVPTKLSVVASPRTTQTDRHGYLYKQGGKQNNKGWRKRYVTFDGQRLRYFSSEKSRVSKRIIPVQVMKGVENDVKDLDSGKYKFKVLTLNRTYLFAAETLEDHHFWTNILMQAIIMYNQKHGRFSMGKGMMLGGAMHTPDMKGCHKLDDNKRYLAIKGGKLCYYNNENDYQFATPIHEISLDTASVKDIGKCKLQLTTPYHTYTLSFECESDVEQWKIALEDGIAAALSDDNVLNEVYQNPSNRQCADCSGIKPYWAVLHLSSIVCSYCAGIHRQFWPYKVKSLRMDIKVWTQPLINLYIEVGNETINSVWESNLTNKIDKITPIATSSQRQMYIIKKYCRKAFFMTSFPHLPSQPTTDQLNWELRKSITSGRISDVIYLINKGADSTAAVDHHTPVELAQSSNHPHIAQYLKHNGAEHELYDDIWAVMRKQLIDDLTLNEEVQKSGHLYKMFSVKKEYPRQWMVLNSNAINCYDEETDSEPKLTIPCRNIINFSRHQNEKNEPSFELTSSRGGNTFIYGADDWDTIYTWMSAIHKVITADTGRPDLGIDFDKAGYAHCKKGSLGVWKCCWVQTKKKCLYILDSERTLTEEIDLRKVHKISLVPPDDMTTPGEEGGQILVLYLSGHYICLQSDLKQETERWHKIIDHCSNEISHNLEDQQLSKDNVPILIERCIEFISLHGMTMKGIYRESGTHSKVTQLLNDFINGARSVHIRLEDYTVHDVANVLKRYLRKLQEPVMSSQLYGKWLSAAMLTSAHVTPSTDDHNAKLYKYKDLLDELPRINFFTLKMVIGHLNRVAKNEAENMMTAANLATVFGPVLLSGSSAESISQERFMNTTYEIQLVIDLMTFYKWLFSVGDSEEDKEDQIQKAIDTLLNANPQKSAPSGEFILGIYVNNNLGEPINMKVSAHKTAADVVEEVAASKRIPRIDGYSLFKVVCSGELERSLCDDEKVLDAFLATSTWNPDHSKGAYLCVKEDTHKDLMEHATGPDISRYTELHFSDIRKSWRKMYFELTSTKLVCYKDRSNSRVSEEWRLADLTIYMGVEKKRKPPTVFGVTFLSVADDKTKSKELPHLGRSICFGTQEEMYTWLATICFAQQGQDEVPELNNMKTSASCSSALGDKKGVSPKNRLQSIAKTFSFKK